MTAVAGAGPGRRLRRPRWLHPGAWWLWAGGMATAAMRTTNPLLLGLILAVVAYVVAARRPSAPWARSFGVFIRLGIFVVVLRVLVQMLFGARLPGTVLFTIPSVELPAFMAGVTLGGPVTAESLVQAAYEGLRLAVVLACFGAVNSLASPYRMLRSLPPVLYEMGVAVTVALAFTPELVANLGRLREARRLRGRPVRGIEGVRGMALPVLEGALDRAVALAASMDVRGYGRRLDAGGGAQRLAGWATGAGLLAICVGTYALLDASAPRQLGLPVLAVGSAAVAVALVAGGKRSARTRYRPDPWRVPEWAVTASGVAASVGVFVVGVVDPASLAPSVYPLVWPALPPVAAVAVVVGLAPAFAAPVPPGGAASGSPTAASGPVAAASEVVPTEPAVSVVEQAVAAP